MLVQPKEPTEYWTVCVRLVLARLVVTLTVEPRFRLEWFTVGLLTRGISGMLIDTSAVWPPVAARVEPDCPYMDILKVFPLMDPSELCKIEMVELHRVILPILQE